MFFFFSSRRRHTRWPRDWSSDVCSSDLEIELDRRGTSKDGNQDADLAFLVVDFFDRTRKVFERTVDNHDVVALFELGERFWLGFIDAHFGFDIFDDGEGDFGWKSCFASGEPDKTEDTLCAAHGVPHFGRVVHLHQDITWVQFFDAWHADAVFDFVDGFLGHQDLAEIVGEPCALHATFQVFGGSFFVSGMCLNEMPEHSFGVFIRCVGRHSWTRYKGWVQCTRRLAEHLENEIDDPFTREIHQRQEATENDGEPDDDGG